MTALQPDAPSTAAAPPRQRAQWSALTRLLTPPALVNLLWTTGVMLAVIAIAVLIARWRGWEVVVINDLDSVTAHVTAGADGVRVVWSLFMVVVAVAIAAVVNQVVLACRTRVLVAGGATRRSVAVGLLLTGVALVLYVLAVAAVVALAVGEGLSGAMSVVGADDGAELARRAAALTGALAAAMAVGTAIAALFLRWHWVVGVSVLVALFAALPIVLGLAWPALGDAVDSFLGWWGANLVVAVLAAGASWLIGRRVPVR
jgi:hypothetical protein